MGSWSRWHNRAYHKKWNGRNAAAAAFNSAASEVATHFRSNYPNILLIPCIEVRDMFINKFLESYKVNLVDQVVANSNIPPSASDFVFDVEPQAGIGFDPVYSSLSSTETVLDFSLILGVYQDDCVD